jgi:threonine dehydrogenase-like Zn-dependent dehydrogenase
VITHRFPLSEVHQAVEVMASGQKNKVILHP